ncbi:DNA repair protein RadC [Persicobacter sp. CCB-QB2]|uniref:RadC family protein n=1 Tax=Persicobacter sp. CCB-QB2 TaxID=1561025 RepID=UPI0006A950FD|nr:DNA repair protein RadC [Persicobacter sp. CCB-QB2]
MTYPSQQNQPINLWAEDDRPREKLQNIGKQNLSNAELLAILLGSGSRNKTAVQLADEILNEYENSLRTLSHSQIKELTKFRGMGEAKAITLIAAMELGERRLREEAKSRTRITKSMVAYEAIQPHFLNLKHEEFWILCLNNANEILEICKISEGGLSHTPADPRIIFQKAIEVRATRIILTHNHPSGNLYPSHSDINLTKKIAEGGRILDIMVVDHLIYTDNGYYSMADENKMP